MMSEKYWDTIGYLRKCSDASFRSLKRHWEQQGEEALIAIALEIRKGKFPQELKSAKERRLANAAVKRAVEFFELRRIGIPRVSVPGEARANTAPSSADLLKVPRFINVGFADKRR